MNELAFVSGQEHLTIIEMADKLGVPLSTMKDRVKKLGLVPAVEGSRTQQGTIAARYSMEAYEQLRKDGEAAAAAAADLALQEKKAQAVEASAAKAIATMSPEKHEAIVRQSMQALEDDFSDEAMDAKMMMMAQAMQMLQKQVEHLKKKLDKSRNEMTVEQYAIRHNMPPMTSAQAGAVTRKLHSQGYNHLYKIDSPQSGLPACVWSKDVLDGYFTI